MSAEFSDLSIGLSLNNVPLCIKIAQEPHHCTWGIEYIIESHNIPDLISSICWMLDLDGYDGSASGCQWDYTIGQLPKEYHFVDVWDHFQLVTPPCGKFAEEEFLTVSCKAKNSTHEALFSPGLVEVNSLLDEIHSESVLSTVVC